VLAHARDYDRGEVWDAIQPSTPKAGTKYGKTPYKVSEAEWECRSTARKTCAQKAIVRANSIQPCQLTGR